MYVNICVSEGGQEEERRLKEVGGRMKKGKRTDLFCQWATNQNCQRMCFFYELVCRCFNETHMHQQKQQSKQSDSISPQCSCSPFLPPSTCPFHFKHQTVAMTTFNALSQQNIPLIGCLWFRVDSHHSDYGYFEYIGRLLFILSCLQFVSVKISIGICAGTWWHWLLGEQRCTRHVCVRMHVCALRQSNKKSIWVSVVD